MEETHIDQDINWTWTLHENLGDAIMVLNALVCLLKSIRTNRSLQKSCSTWKHDVFNPLRQGLTI